MCVWVGSCLAHLSYNEVHLCAKIVEDAGLLAANVASAHNDKPAPRLAVCQPRMLGTMT